MTDLEERFKRWQDRHGPAERGRGYESLQAFKKIRARFLLVERLSMSLAFGMLVVCAIVLWRAGHDDIAMLSLPAAACLVAATSKQSDFNTEVEWFCDNASRWMMASADAEALVQDLLRRDRERSRPRTLSRQELELACRAWHDSEVSDSVRRWSGVPDPDRQRARMAAAMAAVGVACADAPGATLLEPLRRADVHGGHWLVPGTTLRATAAPGLPEGVALAVTEEGVVTAFLEDGAWSTDTLTWRRLFDQRWENPRGFQCVRRVSVREQEARAARAAKDGGG